MRERTARRGFTLAELMVVIMILGVMAAVTGVAFATKAPVPVADARLARVAAARDSAVRTGQPTTVQLDVDGALYLATTYPDGRVITDAPVAIDPLSGRSVRATR